MVSVFDNINLITVVFIGAVLLVLFRTSMREGMPRSRIVYLLVLSAVTGMFLFNREALFETQTMLILMLASVALMFLGRFSR